MTIWRSPKTLEAINAASVDTLMQPLHIVFTEIGADFVRGTMPVDERTRQPYGLLHGGASVALAETLGSLGANMCVDSSRYLCLGQEINANHVRSVRGGWVTGTARPLHLGRSSHVWSVDIVNESGALVCVSRLTMAVLKRHSRQAAGSHAAASPVPGSPRDAN
jgi:1,4-dihydroxy-2-naphthoyl-CoA hydrolase